MYTCIFENQQQCAEPKVNGVRLFIMVSTPISVSVRMSNSTHGSQDRFLTRKIQILFARVPVLQQEFRRSSSNPRTMEYSVKRTTHFNTRRNTLCATKSQRMHHEQTDSYHGLFIIRKSVLQAALAQPAQHYRLPPLYESTPFVPTFLPYIFVLFTTVSKKYGTRSLHVKFNTYS